MQYNAILWNTMQCHATLWHTLAYSGILLHTLAYSGIPWHTLACSGILWHNQCIINNCWRSVPLPCGQYMAIFYFCFNHGIRVFGTLKHIPTKNFCLSYETGALTKGFLSTPSLHMKSSYEAKEVPKVQQGIRTDSLPCCCSRWKFLLLSKRFYFVFCWHGLVLNIHSLLVKCWKSGLSCSGLPSFSPLPVRLRGLNEEQGEK